MLDMKVGGWDGWLFAPYGKAKVWRLLAPNGDFFTPGDIITIRENAQNINTLSAQVARLRALQLPLTHDDFLNVERAYFVLKGLLTMFSPAVTHTIFERRPAPRAFHLARNNQVVPSQAP